MTGIQNNRKLRCWISDVTGVQKLADLNNLENLEIHYSGDGNHVELFTKLAEKNTIKCINKENVTREDLLKIAQIRSLKILVCRINS